MDYATLDMFMRIENAKRDRKRECPRCHRRITRYRNGKFANHKCKDK